MNSGPFSEAWTQAIRFCAGRRAVARPSDSLEIGSVIEIEMTSGTRGYSSLQRLY